MTASPNPDRKLSDYDQALWNWSGKENEYIITQFGVAIIGIGALLFAYGELEAVGAHKGLKIFLGAVGLSASLIVWLHSWGARKTSQAARDEIEDKEFLKITRRVNAWRHQGVYCYLYYPVTRLIGYFAALIGVGWGILLLSVYYDWTFDMLWPVGAVAIGIVFIYAIARRAYEIGQEQQRDKDEENSPPA
jgi:hypothetical protein